jgi:hypothetical protein
VHMLFDAHIGAFPDAVASSVASAVLTCESGFFAAEQLRRRLGQPRMAQEDDGLTTPMTSPGDERRGESWLRAARDDPRRQACT